MELMISVTEKAMAPHSSVLAWRIPGTGEPGGLPSIGSHGVGHDWSDLAAAAAAAAWSVYENCEAPLPTEPSAVMEELHVCTIQNGSQFPHVTFQDLKCGFWD